MNFIILSIVIINLWHIVIAEKSAENVENSQQLTQSASSFIPQLERHQEKRYVSNYNDYGSNTGGLGGSYGGYGGGYGGYGGGYGGYGGSNYNTLNNNLAGYYNNPYYTKNLDGYTGYTGYTGGGYPNYAGAGGYAGYAGYSGQPYNSYYGGRLGGSIGGYPFNRSGYTYQNYPSSYYSSNYANSIIGGGLGGLGTPGTYIPPVALNSAGYHYSPGITGSVY